MDGVIIGVAVGIVVAFMVYKAIEIRKRKENSSSTDGQRGGADPSLPNQPEEENHK
jgi:cell division protein FtsN